MARAIVRSRRDGYDVHEKNGGSDYWSILKACIDENIDQSELIRNHPAMPVRHLRQGGLDLVLTPLVYTNPKRMVFRVEGGGRSFVLKRVRMGAAGFDRVLPWFSGMTYHTRIMLRVDRALRAGFTGTQEYYVVAERPAGAFHREVWLLLQYVEGESLGRLEWDERRKTALASLAEELMRHGLTMDDLTAHNFLVHGERVRAIDISCRPFTRVQIEKMRIKLKNRYGIEVPARGAGSALVHALLRLRYHLRKALGGGEAM